MIVPTLVVRPGEGRSVSLGGMGVVFKLSGADTGGAFAVVEHPIQPGRLVLPQRTTSAPSRVRTSLPGSNKSNPQSHGRSPTLVKGMLAG